jgi:hypothetical protein
MIFGSRLIAKHVQGNGPSRAFLLVDTQKYGCDAVDIP